MPAVSVIIPCYNQEKFLPLCLDSILSQSLGNIEIICIDDGSKDGTGDVLRDYAFLDARIKVVSQENRGPGSCRNSAMEVAEGDYLIFCDSDDEYPNNETLEKLYNAAIKHNVDAVAGSYSVFDASTGRTEYDFGGLLWGQSFEHEGMIRYQDYQFDYGFTRFLFRAEALKRSGARFPCYRRFEDPPFLVSALNALEFFYAIPDVVYRARVEHKQINWDTALQVDLLKGIADNLRYSRVHHLPKLHELTIMRVEKEYGGVYYWALTDERVFAALIHANAEVDWRIFGALGFEYTDAEMPLLAPLRQQVANAQKWDKDIRDLQRAILSERADKEHAWEEVKKLEGELSALYDSTTWKVGSALTVVPRWFRDSK